MKAFYYPQLFLFTLLLMFCVSSCSTDEVPEASPINDSYNINPEEMFPGEVGSVETIKLGNEPFKFNRIQGQAIFQGDILLSDEQVNELEKKGNGANSSTGQASVAKRWPNSIVYYTIDPYLPNQNRVRDAILHWENNTSIRFIQRSSQPNYVFFTVASGCASSVGMVGGRQNIYLGSGCTTGNTIHEIGHAVGLFHEHTRVDRNYNVQINWDNIINGYEHNFRNYNILGNAGFDHGGFDFNSIMLYPSTAFSSNGQPTVEKKYGGTFSAQRNSLSAGDIAGVNNIYNAVNLGSPTNAYAGHYGEEDLEVTWSPVPGATKYFIFTDYYGVGEYQLYRIVNTNSYARELKAKFLSNYRLFISAADDNGNVGLAVEPRYSWR